MTRPAVRRSLRLLASALLLLLVAGAGCAPGCATFDGQTVLVRHSVQRDTLDVLLVYRGLREDGPVADAVALLQKVRNQRVVAVGTPWFALDLDGVLEAPVGERVPPTPESLPALLAGAIVVDFGLWQDAEGRLCGAQRVHVDGVRDILRKFNAGVRNHFLQDTQDLARWLTAFGLDQPDDAARVQKVLAAAPDFAFADLDRGAFALALPVDTSQAPRVRARLLAAVTELEAGAEAGKPDALVMRRLLLEHEVGLLTDGGSVRLMIGSSARDELLLQMQPQGNHDSALAGALRQLDWEIGGPETETVVRAAFDEASAGG